jgi:hypothetical protein
MSKHDICRIVAALLVALIGIAVGFGSFLLWNGAPASWPDVVATGSTVKGIARGMMVMALMLLIAGTATTLNPGWGSFAAAIAVAIFVAAGFWANYVLFGDIRIVHTGTNVVIGALILWLLWIAHSGRET